MSWFYCSDDEVRKIIEKELSEVDTLIEIIKEKAGDYGSLFVYIPQSKNYSNKNAKIIIEVKRHDEKFYFTILFDKKSYFLNMKERTYYKGSCYKCIHFYNIFLSASLIKDFITQLFSSSCFTSKSLITMHLGATGVNVIHELYFSKYLNVLDNSVGIVSRVGVPSI